MSSENGVSSMTLTVTRETSPSAPLARGGVCTVKCLSLHDWNWRVCSVFHTVNPPCDAVVLLLPTVRTIDAVCLVWMSSYNSMKC